MPVACPNCGGSHPKWDCKRQLTPDGARRDLAPVSSAPVVYEGIPEGVVIPKNGIPRWVNEWPQGNFEAKIAKGYLVILNKDGSHVTRKSGNENLLQYLMVAPERLSGPPPKKDWNETIQHIQSNGIIDGTAQEIAGARPPATVKDYLEAVKDLPPPKKAAARLPKMERKAVAEELPVGFDRIAYQREYMKKYRAKKKGEP